MGCAFAAVGGPLWQWDLDRVCEVAGAEPGDLMDFALVGEEWALATEADADGNYPIPNGLLKSGRDLRVMLRRDMVTVAAGRLCVRPRPMPPDYRYTETPTVGYLQLRRELLDRMATLEARFGELWADGAIAFGHGEPPEDFTASMYIDLDTYDVYGLDREQVAEA